MGQLSYLLDTNILSEPAKKQPDEQVMSRLQQHSGSYCTCAIVWRELRYGWAKLPDSSKKRRIGDYMSALIEGGLVILPFDHDAADWLGVERARLEAKGHTPSLSDSEIAAVAATNNLVLVTRNTKDFSMFQGLVVENWFNP